MTTSRWRGWRDRRPSSCNSSPPRPSELSRTGAPFDVVLARDVESGLAPPYRLLLFPNLFHCDSERRERLHRSLARRPCTTVWIGAPGFVGDGRVEDALAEALCGLRLRIPEQPHRNVVIVPGDDPVVYGSPYWFETTPVVDDDDAEILGCYQHSADVGLARRKSPWGATIFSGAPAVSGRLLARWASEAGVHLYVEGPDGLYADSRFVAIHSREAGIKELRVPSAPLLYDVVNEVQIAPDAQGAFRVRLPRGETGLFFRGSEALWRQ